MTRRFAGVLAAVGVLVALAGCTLMAPGSAGSATPDPEPHATIEPSDVLAALGAVPPDPQLTDELLDDYFDRWLDWQWDNLTRTYPDAVRPQVAEIARATGSNPAGTACQDEARSAGAVAQEASASDPAAQQAAARQSAVDVFVCSVEYPSLPNGTLSRDQARYLYDYWTRFVLPCYAAAGYPDDSTPPSREFFADNWPFQNWAPQPARGSATAGDTLLDDAQADCPAIPEGLDG